MKQLLLRLPDKVHKAIRQQAVDKETSMTDIVLSALKKDKVITQDQIDSE